MGWHGLYKEQWQGAITPEAFSHPAKVSRGLARKIYAYAIEQGWLKPGDTCLDPFAGIGGFALDALANGLNFVGVELEQNFVDMGAGCDCTGISKADWVRCFGRWKRFAHLDDRHWCPRCLAEAGGVIEPRPPTLPGMDPDPTASYERNSGKIPYTRPHRYAGNLDLFARHARGGATAVLVQGDSRNLTEVLEGVRAEGIVASPPYVSGGHHNGVFNTWGGKLKGDKGCAGWATKEGGYGEGEGNLGNMPTGEPPSAVISSPPWESNLSRDGRGTNLKIHDQLEKRYRRRYGERSFPKETYGDSDGQLGTMPTGEPPQAIISSPPYATQTVHDRCDIDPDKLTGNPPGPHSQALTMANYGNSEGQLGTMREGDVDAVIASPPFADSQQGRRADFVLESTKVNPTPRKLGDRSYFPAEMESEGQLAALPEGEPPQVGGLVSSPPYEGSMSHEDHGIDWSKAKKDYPGRLMHPQRSTAMLKRHHDKRRYGSGTDNLGNQQGNTFWSAAKAILQQCHAVLAPGGVAIFVTKRFVRDKKKVEFSQQWADLCQSCGFELIEWIKAWLVEERGTQYDLGGEAHTKTVKRFSFFRRLHARKYPHLAIEWEDVLIFRKGKEPC